MTAQCLVHGEFEMAPHGLPECPECIRGRFRYANGDDPKHTATGAAAARGFASYRSDQINSQVVFDYLQANKTDPSGCMIYFHTGHKSFNAVSLEPCGKIPGSGISPARHFACHLAILQDITGKSSKGPHWAYEDLVHFQNRVAKGEFVPAPRCVVCATVPVYLAGSKCPACIAK
jgi:hypothetical protein